MAIYAVCERSKYPQNERPASGLSRPKTVAGNVCRYGYITIKKDTSIFEVKSYFTSDIENFIDQKSGAFKSFLFPLEIRIGLATEEAADIFSILVLSADNKDKASKNDKRLVLPIFDVDLIKAYVEKILTHANQSGDPMILLRQHFSWEFEDYSIPT